MTTDIKFDDEAHMEFMNKKAQELELRNIMQGLEEFATFMSFKGNSAGLRILSVESITQPEQVKLKAQTAQVINIPQQQSSQSNLHAKKSLSAQDREYH
tara:strand:+ start:14080 stop:14376 length:297 start_codon:yes stop_codon:yes gene_type:complete